MKTAMHMFVFSWGGYVVTQQVMSSFSGTVVETDGKGSVSEDIQIDRERQMDR